MSGPYFGANNNLHSPLIKYKNLSCLSGWGTAGHNWIAKCTVAWYWYDEARKRLPHQTSLKQFLNWMVWTKMLIWFAMKLINLGLVNNMSALVLVTVWGQQMTNRTWNKCDIVSGRVYAPQGTEVLAPCTGLLILVWRYLFPYLLKREFSCYYGFRAV